MKDWGEVVMSTCQFVQLQFSAIRLVYIALGAGGYTMGPSVGASLFGALVRGFSHLWTLGLLWSLCWFGFSLKTRVEKKIGVVKWNAQ